MSGLIEQIIREWLQENPDGEVRIAVGYASVWGMAWLAENIPNRPVTLLIGDTRTLPGKATIQDLDAAIRFLERSDVKIRSWWRTDKHVLGKSGAHLKTWMIEHPTKPTAILCGSANLTKNGLRQNREMMVEPAEKFLLRSVEQMKQLFAESWDITNDIKQRISNKEAHRRARGVPKVQSRTENIPEQTPQRKPPGCLSTVAAIIILFFVLLIAVSLCSPPAQP